MMPLADLVPLSGSNSNQSSSRSADDCVTQLGDPVELLLATGSSPYWPSFSRPQQVAQAQRRRIRRHQSEDRLDRLGRARHHRDRIRRRPRRRAANDDRAPARQVVVVPAGQVVAVVHRRDRARQRQDLQAVPRQFEVADDLRAQQADDVRELAEAIAREDFGGHRGAADDFAPFEHDDLLAGAREVGGRDQAVVAGADDDGVVLIAAGHDYFFFHSGS